MALALSWLAAPAAAQTDAVTIAMASCGAMDGARLARQVELELRVAGIPVVDAVSAPADATHVTIVPPGCLPGEGAAIVVRAPGRAPLRRALEITGDDADRVVALALVDAVRRAWAEPREDADGRATADALEALRADAERERGALQRVEETIASLRAAQAEERAARAREATARAALPGWDLFGGGAVIVYEGGAALVGATLGGGLTLIGPLRLALEVAGGYGVVRDPLGEVGLGAVRGALALELHVRAAPLGGFVGAWASAGWSRAEGRPDDASRAEGAALEDATGGLGLRAGGSLELDASWSLFARVDVGYGVGGVIADAGARRVAATRGALLSVAIGLRFHP